MLDMPYIYNPSNYNYSNITLGAAGSAGQVYTTSGAGTATWTTAAASTSAMTVNQSGKISLKGDNADLDINGVSLKETLESIQEMLGVMKMDPALETEFEELRAAGERYRVLREKFREQKAVWDTLKREDL